MRNKSVSLVCTVMMTVVISLFAIELYARLSGFIDFPLFLVDDKIGYLPRPNQSGRFLKRNSWAFNDKSMATPNFWSTTERLNVLLIGNSVVMGGNPYDDKDKVGQIMQSIIGDGYAVWPIAAGGWSNLNEIAYLKANADVVNATHFFVWEYMSGGLSKLSTWRGDYVFPRESPPWAGWYLFRRYVLPLVLDFKMSELPPTGAVVLDYQEMFDEAVASLSKASGLAVPGIIFLYPDEAQYRSGKSGIEWLPERQLLEQICRRYGLRLVDISRDASWNEKLYRDGTHPTIEGNRVIARVLSSSIIDALHN